MVFFDVGDTLVERVDDPVATVVRDLRAIGVEATGAALADALAAMAHAYASGVYAPSTLRGERGLWRAMAHAALGRLPGGARPRRVAALVARLEGYPAHYRPVAGMPGLVADLQAAGRPVGIISNWPPSLPRLLAALGYGGFRIVACSGPRRRTKPGPDLFRWALKAARVRPEAAWHVGNDPQNDYGPASALGMRAVLWDPGRRAGREYVRAGTAEELRALLL